MSSTGRRIIIHVTFHKFLQYLDRFQRSTNVISSPDYRTDQLVTLVFKPVEATQINISSYAPRNIHGVHNYYKLYIAPLVSLTEFWRQILLDLNGKFHSSSADNEWQKPCEVNVRNFQLMSSPTARLRFYRPVKIDYCGQTSW